MRRAGDSDRTGGAAGAVTFSSAAVWKTDTGIRGSAARFLGTDVDERVAPACGLLGSAEAGGWTAGAMGASGRAGSAEGRPTAEAGIDTGSGEAPRVCLQPKAPAWVSQQARWYFPQHSNPVVYHHTQQGGQHK